MIIIIILYIKKLYINYKIFFYFLFYFYFIIGSHLSLLIINILSNIYSCIKCKLINFKNYTINISKAQFTKI